MAENMKVEAIERNQVGRNRARGRNRVKERQRQGDILEYTLEGGDTSVRDPQAVYAVGMERES